MKKISVIVSIIVFGATAAFATPPAGYGLVWSDEFEGTAINTEYWGFEVGCTGWGNAEKQYYTDGANVTLEGGAAVLWAKREAPPTGSCQYTSARMVSKGKKNFTYGYLEAKLKAPSGNGLWPAFWTLGESISTGAGWPACGEMELYEGRTGTWSVGGSVGDNVFIGTCHFKGASGTSYNSKQYVNPEGLNLNYHVYAILWDSAFVEYYFDDKVYWARTATPNICASYNYEAFHNPHFFLANIAIGGNYLSSAGIQINNSIFPQKMSIDYVRVYQKGASAVNKDVRKHIRRSFALVNPSTAQLKVYDLSGKLVADYTDKVRGMKAGDDVMKSMAPTLSRGAYLMRLFDNGMSLSQKFVMAR